MVLKAKALETMAGEIPICATLSVEAGRFSRTPTRRKRRPTRRGPDRSSAYLAWIRTLRCAVCLKPPSDYFRIEAAHTSVLGPRGLGQRSSDFSAVPLCYWHHQGNRDSYHRLGERLFAQTHQVHLGELVLALNEFYEEMTGEGPQGMYGRVRTRESRDPMFPGIETAIRKGTA
jgi:hypothetical protein